MKTLSAIVLTLAVLCAAHSSFAQKDNPEDNPYGPDTPDYDLKEPRSFGSFGFGLGIDYGGIGARLTLMPAKFIGLFGAAGYNTHKVGYNLGVSGYILPDKKVCPVFSVMYGYNAVITVDGASQFDKTYYGPSIAGGIILNRKSGNTFWNFELVVPFRSSEFYDDLDKLQRNPAITGANNLPPFGISVGFHIKLGGGSGF